MPTRTHTRPSRPPTTPRSVKVNISPRSPRSPSLNLLAHAKPLSHQEPDVQSLVNVIFDILAIFWDLHSSAFTCLLKLCNVWTCALFNSFKTVFSLFIAILALIPLLTFKKVCQVCAELCHNPLRPLQRLVDYFFPNPPEKPLKDPVNHLSMWPDSDVTDNWVHPNCH
ncbi:hypothetical protein F4778DRAFT_722333 [Xylariomycetidae sp. FL2044]|nr:hypothetical protein F4778DRAFT_722333 [Xylariomycetidae sp. FL2044]